jgi:aconitate hydratase
MVKNMAIELELNRERYGVLRWAEGQFGNLRAFPPGNGILHQVNVEHLATVVATAPRDGERWAFPDTLVGTDSHTPMVNGLGVFGWGVGGIEATTALLGQPVGLLVPRVVGCRVTGAPRPGVLAADVALTLTGLIRPLGLLGAVVEFFGPGLDALAAPERATIANMAPEYGATMGFFPVPSTATSLAARTTR